MGFTTDFNGSFSFSRPLTVEEREHLVEFSIKRHTPEGKPGYWLQWIPNEDGTALKWDGGEKFYNYIEWLEYLIENFFSKWGVMLNGTVEWRGEDWDDTGSIQVTDNIIEIQKR